VRVCVCVCVWHACHVHVCMCEGTASSSCAHTRAARRRPGFPEEDWAEALQECGTISGFEDIVAEVLERVRVCVPACAHSC
jgi:hypothetical protein